MSDEDSVRYERNGNVGRVVLDRPPVNVLNIETLRTLTDRLRDTGRDPQVRAIVLTGTGRAFCGGVDVAEHRPDRVDEMLAVFHETVRTLLSSEVPVVVGLNGPALGGGCELALAADVVIGRAGSRLGQPEVRLGFFPPVAIVLLPRIVGRQRAADLILSGRSVDMGEALQMGLVSRVFPAESFEAELDAYAAGIASRSRGVLRLAKEGFRRVDGRTVPEGLNEAETLYGEELMALSDPLEGVEAFLEKREPVWSDE